MAQNETINELRLTLMTQNKTAMSMLNNLEEQVSQQREQSIGKFKFNLTLSVPSDF